jgi:hypothetical protein
MSYAGGEHRPRAYRVRRYDFCANDGSAKLVCTIPYGSYIGPDGGIADSADVTATKAALGEKGKLTVTLMADGISPAKRTVDVNVAEGVGLAAGADRTVTAKPRADFEAPVQVTNNTARVVHGTALLADAGYGFAGSTRFSNGFTTVTC